jgi:dTDP-4-dehydrorhamnose 3,5-epimerase
MKEPVIIPIDAIDGVLKIELDYYSDNRGINFEGYNKELYRKLHPIFEEKDFIIDSFSRSRMNVLRGFHGDTKTYKLIQVLFGKLQFVMIDKRIGKTKGNIAQFYLDSEKPTQILIPAGVVNAHLCLSQECLFSYKLSCPYVDISEQVHVPWHTFINWDTGFPILSDRDNK